MTPDQLSALANTSQPNFGLPQSPNPGAPAAPVNIDQELNALADIHLPDQISWWPPAPGWWIVLILAIFIGYFSIRYINKKRRQNKFRKQAVVKLQQLNRFWQKQQNLIATASRLSALMRRIAMANTNPGTQRSDIASLTDKQWLLYLDQQAGLKDISKNYKELLVELPYQDPMVKFDMQEHQQLAKKMDQLLLLLAKWVKKGFKHV